MSVQDEAPRAVELNVLFKRWVVAGSSLLGAVTDACRNTEDPELREIMEDTRQPLQVALTAMDVTSGLVLAEEGALDVPEDFLVEAGTYAYRIARIMLTAACAFASGGRVFFDRTELTTAAEVAERALAIVQEGLDLLADLEKPSSDRVYGLYRARLDPFDLNAQVYEPLAYVSDYPEDTYEAFVDRWIDSEAKLRGLDTAELFVVDGAYRFEDENADRIVGQGRAS